MPVVTKDEWRVIEAAIAEMPPALAESVLQRIQESASADHRPVVCPLLDTCSGSCLVYPARPVACRAYGFYAEREKVLGCRRIEAIARDVTDVVWGNHLALEDRLREMGAARALYAWLESENREH